MALPYIQNLVQDIKYVIRRFPLEILFAVIGTIAAIENIEISYTANIVSKWCFRMIMTANLGLLVSLSASLYFESRAIKGPRLYLFKIIIALLVSCLIFFLNPLERSSDYVRFLLLSLTGHLLVSFAAYINVDSIQGFWQFNKTLFIRFLTGALYSGVLYVGLAAAISAIKFLFNFDLGSNIYANLWVFIVGIFNTLFFLAGIPKDLASLNNDFTYPKALKIFTQYVLIPLATVYVVILLAYEAKILVQWNLPKGLVSNLILGYAVFGILSLLLVFPIREQEENTWIKTYARSFYFLMFPLLVLLFLAVGTRVFKYGITEYRYFLIVLAIWLLTITVYSLIARRQNIKLIPISLCIFTLFSVYGPQSAFSISEYSQTKILTDIFKRNNAFRDHRMVVPKNMSQKDGNQAARTLKYIIDKYDYTALQSYVNVDLAHIADSLEKTKDINKSIRNGARYELTNLKVKWLQDYLGLGKFSTSNYDDDYTDKKTVFIDNYFIRENEPGLIQVKGYDYILEESNYEHTTIKNPVMAVTIKEVKKGSGILSIHLNNDTAQFNLTGLMTDLLRNPDQLNRYKETKNTIADYQYALPADLLQMTSETKNFRIVFKISAVRFERIRDKSIKNISHYNGVFLIKVK